VTVVPLGGDWELVDPATGRTWPALVPGSVHLDLLRAGEIPDPFFGRNELDVAWIGEREWVYRCGFDAPPGMADRRHVLVRFLGLDTLATVRLNGRVVLRADNMHRTWEVDVTGRLQAAGNELEVTFASPLKAVRRLQRQRPLPGWWDMMCEPGGSWLRKELCNFGWDWGPALVTAGVWRPVELVAFDADTLDHVHVRQRHADGVVTLHAEGAPGAWLTASRHGVVVASGRGPVVIEEPELWWPNGLGEQPLYDVAVELADGSAGHHLRIGLRTMSLDTSDDSFAFSCNGVPFFAKGANWIPADAVVGRASPEHIRRLVDDAADVHMNMLRVWGGGVYEDDAFYDACDERGICVWQDFMFACATYPSFDAGFMATVRAEAEDNVRRLRHHACMALWCGNNELEMGLVDDEWGPAAMGRDDYRALFEELLPEVVAELDPDSAYWPASPHAPGDAHVWDVWHGGRPFDWYRSSSPLFVSEFGFESLPCPRTVESFTTPEDQNLTSPVLDHHQRGTVAGSSGTGHLVRQMLDWFRAPCGFEEAVWQTQILQAIAVGIGIEHWRTQMPRTMGALYWQLNDAWPGWSWSSIDYAGRWKALHYAARRLFAPVLLAAVVEPGTHKLAAHVCNDGRAPVSGELRVEVTRADGTPVRELAPRRVKVGAQQSRRVTVWDLAKDVAGVGADDALVWLELVPEEGSALSTLAAFCPPKALRLVEPGLHVTTSSDGVHVRIEAQAPALWVWPEADGVDGRWSDAFVHVRPGRPVELTCAPAVADVRVRSLIDTW
jgi:beta-mannosidase